MMNGNQTDIDINQEEDEMCFAEEDVADNEEISVGGCPWRILIVDDEPEVHQVTRLTLSNVTYEGRTLEFISAYSGGQAIEMLAKETDIAIVLLDVVMESKNAGLETAIKIREYLNNSMIRIILRTGQPGSAPSSEVILNYDINDYKEKSELTYDRLLTCVISGLRTYKQLVSIEKCRKNLEKIINATAQYCCWPNKTVFAEQLLAQISDLLNLGDHSLYLLVNESDEPDNNQQPFSLLAGRGNFSSLTIENFVGERNGQLEEMNRLIVAAIKTKTSQYSTKFSGIYFNSDELGAHIILVQKHHCIVDDTDLKLLDFFINNTLLAFNNMMKYQMA